MRRRTFLGGVVKYGALAGLGHLACKAPDLAVFAQDGDRSSEEWPVAIFSKVFQKHTYDELADAVVKIGADGIEAPIRRGGHIEPHRVREELPRMVDALASRGKKVLIAATDITGPGDETETVLETLRDLEISHYRTGYYRYAEGTSRLRQVREFASQARSLAKLNEAIGIVGVYQNHAGPHYVGHVIWDLATLFEGMDSQWLGVALDIRHLRSEIGVSWQAMVELIRPHVLTVYAKNSTWVNDGNPRLVEVPLDQGMADRQMFRGIWKSIKRLAPLSVHVEHLGQKPLGPQEAEEMIEACRHDVAVLRSWMA